MKALASLFFLSFLFALPAFSQTINYDIFLFGSKIGYMQIIREAKPDGSEVYSLDTKTEAKILWIKRQNHTHYEVVYKSGKLVSSQTTEIENGDKKRWTNVSWDGTKYLVDSYKGKFILTEVPVFSIVILFTKGLSPGKKLFYEAEADFNTLLKTDEPDTWEFKSSDGNKNVYHFLNGRIQSVDLHVSIATIKMVRVN